MFDTTIKSPGLSDIFQGLQPLFHHNKKFGDFSSVEHGEDIIFKLTINTDGVVPKGHGTNEIWPIYIQVADLPDHIKTLIESVAVQSVISDNGKPSEFAFEVALTSLIEWIHEQGEGLKLRVSATKEVKVFFEIHNLSADLAAVCHVFHFASWASSSEACMLCKVQPVREHNAQRWNIVDEGLIRRNNMNITLDMLRRQGGFKSGATFWMKLANVLNYRFDNLHKICEGVCATLLNELFGTTRKMGPTLKIRQQAALENAISSINWPTNTKIIFDKLSTGTGHEKLGSFLVAVPLALSTSNMKYEFIVWIFSLIGLIYAEFAKSSTLINKKSLLQKTAKLQSLLCGTVFSTLKFHYFFVHLYEKTDSVEKVSTFVFETLNRYIKLRLDPNHQKGFIGCIMDNFLLERVVRFELQRRAKYCPQVKEYLDKIDWRLKTKKGIEMGDIVLKRMLSFI
uniref:Uncharacterized protein n=1 Tax=Panagrolaimus davidi TaxID=227884 RepID=A0A914QFQ1_9BILA